MKEFLLKYGPQNKVLTLTKSDDLIAVKLKQGSHPPAIERFTPVGAGPRGTPSTLGGFRVLHIDDIPGSGAESTLDMMRADGSVVTGSHVFTTSDDGVPFVPTGQLYVRFSTDASEASIEGLIDEHKLELIEARGDRTFILQVTPESANPVKTAIALQASPLVKTAEPDLATPGKLKGFALPTDHLLQDQWHLRNVGDHRGTQVGFKDGADARVVAAWERAKTLGDPMVIVAIIDDGFDLNHPDLSGAGKIVAPWDFTRNGNDPSSDPLEGDRHGTACAGVAVGNANGEGIVGAAPGCRLMPLRWCRGLSDREIETWFDWAREQGAWVVSCSWGAAASVYEMSSRLSDAISRCAREGRNGLGTVICFAAGNSNHDINDPRTSLDGFAVHPEVIAVAASTSRDEKSNYSNYGKEIAVCAPSSGAGGWKITTTDATGRFLRRGVMVEAGYSPGPYTNEFGGTSSACPLVAGICALLLSVKPQMRATEVKALIQKTARRIGNADSYDATGHSYYYGYGCIDALAALKAI